MTRVFYYSVAALLATSSLVPKLATAQHSDEKTPDQLLRMFQKSISTFIIKIETGYVENRKEATRVITEFNTATEGIFTLVNQIDPKTESFYEVMESLKISESAISKLTRDTLTLNNLKVIENITRDFRIKQLSASPLSLGHAYISDVSVNVFVMKEGVRLPGHIVYCNYVGNFDNLDNKRKESNNPTNNAQFTLQVGVYIFWIETENGDKITKVGDIGTTNRQLDTVTISF